jgi:hypothetical protein
MNTLNCALRYAAEGFPIFPVYGFDLNGKCTCNDHGGERCTPGKHPVTHGGFKDATTDPAQIKAWWATAEGAGLGDHALNVGMAIPDGLVAVDVDPKNDGEVIWNEWVRQGKIPPTRMTRTGSGGIHAWYKIPPGYALPGKLGKGVDVKQFGGYVVAPPSLHESGKHYEAIGYPDAEIVDAPQWLLDQLRPRGADTDSSEPVIIDETAMAADPAELDAIVEILEPHCIDGQKHQLCKAFGGWAKQRGLEPGDVEYVLDELLSRATNVKNHQAGIQTGLWAFTPGVKPFGYNELRDLGVPAESLDNAPNPRRKAQRELAAAGMQYLAPSVERMQREAEAQLTAADAVPTSSSNRFKIVDISREPGPLSGPCPALGVANGIVCALVAEAYGAKTPTQILLALSVANGVPFLGVPTTQCKVAIGVSEKTRNFQRKLTRIARAHNLSTENVQVFDLQSVKLDDQGAIADLRAQFVDRWGAGMIAIDTYNSSVNAGADPNEAKFAAALKILGTTCQDVALVPLIHCRKRDSRSASSPPTLGDVLGTTALAGALDAAIGVYRQDPKTMTEVTLCSVRAVENAFEPIHVRWQDVSGPNQQTGVQDPQWGLRATTVDKVADLTQKAANITDAQRAEMKLREGFRVLLRASKNGQVSHGELVQYCGMRKSTVTTEINHLVRENLLAKGKGGTTGSPHAVYYTPGQRWTD